MKKGIIIFSTIIIVLIISGIVFKNYYSKKSLPNYSHDILTSEVIEEVIIYRDSNAVPHIFAKNESDLYFAVGYVMAQDRLWQMDLIRRVTQGRISEIFGKDYLEADKMLRCLQINKKSKQVYDSLNTEMKNSLLDFARGVNYYAANNVLPIEYRILSYDFENWIPENSLNIIGYIGWELGTAWEIEILLSQIRPLLDDKKFAALLPDYDKSNVIYDIDFKDTILLENTILSNNKKILQLGVIPLMASNNWVIAPQKSQTGKPILANDMHLAYSLPGMWYPIHQNVENKINVTGLCIPGSPAVIVGHNDSIAWGMTNVMVDDIDFYVETINQENKYQYKLNEKWVDFTVINEQIKTKEGETIDYEILFNHRGPMVSDIKKLNQKISMCWIGYKYSNEYQSVYQLNRANNWDEFKTAISKFGAVSVNIAYADMQGNIGMYCAAGVPIRKGDGFSIYSGDTDFYDCTKLVDFDSLPYSYNPPTHYLASANNKSAANYPYYITHWYYNDYRIDRIEEMLKSKDKLSVEDFMKMQTDKHSQMTKKYLKDIIFEVSTTDLNDKLIKQTVEMLAKWNGEMTAESQEATIFDEFIITLSRHLMRDEIGDSLTTLLISDSKLIYHFIDYVWNNKHTYWCDNINTKDKAEEFSDMIISAYSTTIENLKNKLGDNPQKWEWGKLHTLQLQHPLGKVKILDLLFNFNSEKYQVGGSMHTVCPYAYDFNEPYITTKGASHRTIYSFADWDLSKNIIPAGISGEPASEYYTNQMKYFIGNQYFNDYFSKNKIIETKKYEMRLLKK